MAAAGGGGDGGEGASSSSTDVVVVATADDDDKGTDNSNVPFGPGEKVLRTTIAFLIFHYHYHYCLVYRMQYGLPYTAH